MQCRVSYEYSLNAAPENFVVQVPSQLVDDIPANIPRVLLPEYIAELLPLAEGTLVSPMTPLWGRAQGIELIDTLLDLTTRHGFTLAESLRKMLDPVPDSELFAILKESGFHA